MDRAEKKTPEQEAIAFLRSMLKLVERRGLRHVDQQFGLSMTAMASAILSPDNRTRDSRAQKAVNGATYFVDEIQCVPVSVLKAMVLVIEEEMAEPKHEPTTTGTSSEATP